MEVEKEGEALVVYGEALELHTPNKRHVITPHPRKRQRSSLNEHRTPKLKVCTFSPALYQLQFRVSQAKKRVPH